jgi:hypothetical protein
VTRSSKINIIKLQSVEEIRITKQNKRENTKEENQINERRMAAD